MLYLPVNTHKTNTVNMTKNTEEEEEELKTIQVFSRIRPFRIGEDDTTTPIVANDPYKLRYRHTSNSKTRKLDFNFDYIFKDDSTQTDVFDKIGKPHVDKFVSGYNGCIMAYGVTGSGKTHTLFGTEEQPGMIPRCATYLFEVLQTLPSTSTCSVRFSMVEVYMENIFDLLNGSVMKGRDRPKLELGHAKSKKRKKHPEVIVKGAELRNVGSANGIMRLIREGEKNRTTAATDMNAHSSRSHSIACIHLSIADSDKKSAQATKLYIVDLAGSEPVKLSGVTGKSLKEAQAINLSLSTLSRVVQGLSKINNMKPREKKDMKKSLLIPYRDSKLTRMLSNSLGGNSLTSIILACSPSSLTATGTLQTLQFGATAQKMPNRVRKNIKIGEGEYKKVVQKLKERLAQMEVQILEKERQNEELELKLEEFKRIHSFSNQQGTLMEDLIDQQTLIEENENEEEEEEEEINVVVSEEEEKEEEEEEEEIDDVSENEEEKEIDGVYHKPPPFLSRVPVVSHNEPEYDINDYISTEEYEKIHKEEDSDEEIVKLFKEADSHVQRKKKQSDSSESSAQTVDVLVSTLDKNVMNSGEQRFISEVQRLKDVTRNIQKARIEENIKTDDLLSGTLSWARKTKPDYFVSSNNNNNTMNITMEGVLFKIDDVNISDH